MKPRAGVSTISRVAFLLTLQGSGQIALAFLEVLTVPMTFFYAARSGRALPSNLGAAALFGWLLLVTVAGIVSLRAARLNREYRGRRTALAALLLGPVSCLFGLPILAYGIWSYRRPEVLELFSLGEAGVSVWDIEHET